MTVLANIIVVGFYQPLTSKLDQFIKMANEVVLMFCVYALIGFTDFNETTDKFLIGSLTITFVIV